MSWSVFFLAIFAVLIAWLIYRNIKGNPEAFSKSNFNKSARTMGLLAIFLIIIIAVCVLML